MNSCALYGQNYPLSFDARVASPIARLSSNKFPTYLDVKPKQDVQSYYDYVLEIHQLAQDNNLPAENIEFFLFQGVLNQYFKSVFVYFPNKPNQDLNLCNHSIEVHHQLL